VEIHVRGRGHRRRQRHALVDDLPVHALARRVEDARHVDDVAQLETRQLRVADRRRQVHLAHAEIVETLGRHSIPSRR
jgi:hypothetical protein